MALDDTITSANPGVTPAVPGAAAHSEAEAPHTLPPPPRHPGSITFLVVDLETTGLSPPATVIELGMHLVEWMPASRTAVIPARGISSWSWLYHPGDSVITPANRAIHHIDPRDLRGRPVFDLANWRAAWEPFAADYIVAHNARFERQWLDPLIAALPGPAPRWICTERCVRRLFLGLESYSNQALRYELLSIHEATSTLLDPPHRALPDARLTGAILTVLLKCHAGFRADPDVEELARWTEEPAVLRSLRFGKHKDVPCAEVPPDYWQWLLSQPHGTFDPDVIATARRYAVARDATTTPAPAHEQEA